MPFTYTIRPRYAEVDMQGVVFNAHWLTFFDDCSTRFFEHVGFTPKEVFTESGPFDVMVVKAVLEWHRPAGFDDFVVVEVRPDRVGTSSFDLRYTARVDDRVACVGVITYVSVKPGTKESCPIPHELRAPLERGLAEPLES